MDNKAGKYLQAAQGADKLGRVGQLARALEAIVTREATNGELRIVDPDGVGVTGPYSHADVAAALEGAQDALSIGVQALGRYEDDFRGAFIQALTKRGYKVTDLAEGDPGSLDVLICANIRIEDEGKGLGDAAHLAFARAVVLGEVKNVAQGKVIAAFDERKREGHRNLDEAERKAVRGLATIISNKAGAKIDSAMKAGTLSAGSGSGGKVSCGPGPAADAGQRKSGTASPPAAEAPARPSSPPPRAGTPAEDAHWVQPDDFFIADRPLGSGYISLSLAKMVQEPGGSTKGEAEFFSLARSANVWTRHFWRSRIADGADLRVGAVVICYEGGHRDGAYRGPQDKSSARPGAWFMGRITDTSDLYKGLVQVSGYQCAPDALRVPAE
ncbi:MAG: hypothetical protein HYZ27_09305 [Deltaproteobacteria bacterium]|nr:hypothetical protein [Deltaproteobacteria bacterium]